MAVAPTVPAVDAATRWTAVGRSTDPDAATAGATAAAAALAGRALPRLVLVFASDDYDLDRLLAGVRGVTGDTPLIGCSTAGEIATGGPSDGGAVVMVLGGEGFTVATCAATDAAADLRGAGGRAAEVMLDLPAREHSVLLLLTDGLAGDQTEVVRGAYGVLGAEVPLVGGCAGDDLRMTATRQMHGGTVLRDAVVAAAITSDAPIGIGVAHGWRRLGEPVLVTSSHGSRLLTLDDEPALDVYLRHLDAPAEVREDPAVFTRWAMTHPLGLARRSGEEVRFIAGADFAERSLLCVARVPQGGLAWFMRGDGESVLRATDVACADALAGLGDRPPVGLVAFDCIARKGVLADSGIQQEVDRISQRAGDAPVVGFYTYGEIARVHGTAGLHNQTLVVLAFG